MLFLILINEVRKIHFPLLYFTSAVKAATVTEVFPCFFLSCKANARVKCAKTGHGPHSS
jgi:hypothetical protein